MSIKVIDKELKQFIKNDAIYDTKIFEFIEENINEIIDYNFKDKDKKLLAIIINYAKEKYYNDEPVISDYVYDELADKLSELDPTNKVLTSVGYKLSSINKVELPYHMGSMNKIVKKYNKTNDDSIDSLIKFKTKYKGPYIISNKMDGISAMLSIKKGIIKMFTRGDGKVGSDITHLINYINIKNFEEIKKIDNIIFRCELIMKIKTFDDKYKLIGSNPRNFVSGQINSKELKKSVLNDIDLIFYEIIEPWTSIDKQYNKLTILNMSIAPFELISYDKLTIENLSHILKKRKNDSLYEIDGIIISDTNLHERNKDGNPSYSFAFKETLPGINATVEQVEWNISKDGYIKPRIKIIPIKFGGVNITYATAHNAKYIFDNKIGPGAIITITRSGDVIPYILKVVKPVTNPQMPSKKLGWEWNKTGVDIIISTFTPEQLIKTLAYFVKALDIKNIDESTFKVLVDNKIITTLSDIFYLEKKDMDNLLGFGNKKIEKILNELDIGFKKMHLLDLMHASNIFGHGFGFKRLKKIMETYPDIIIQIYKSENILIKMIDDIEGFDEITAKQFVDALDKFIEFLDEIPKNIKDRLMLDTIPKKKNKKKVSLNGIKIVFTGFRNKQWEQIISDLGGEISNSVSKNTNILVCNDPEENSNKINKAKELQIKILSKEEFPNYFKQKYNINLIDLSQIIEI